MTTSRFEYIPPEVFTLILSSLPSRKTRLDLACVSRHFQPIIFADIWQTLEFQTTREVRRCSAILSHNAKARAKAEARTIPTEAYCKSFYTGNDYGAYVQVLDFSKIQGKEDLDDNLLVLISKYCPNVRVLNSSGVSNFSDKGFSTCCETWDLEELLVSGPHWAEGNFLLAMVKAGRHQRLRVLEMRYWYQFRPSKILPVASRLGLQRLVLDQACKSVDEKAALLDFVERTLPTLAELSVECVAFGPAEMSRLISFLVDSASKVDDIDHSYPSAHPKWHFSRYSTAQNRPEGLVYLNISRMAQISASSLAKLAKLQSLRGLSVRHGTCRGKEDTLAALISQLSLEQLYISRTSMTVELVEAISRCTHLETLGLSNVTEDLDEERRLEKAEWIQAIKALCRLPIRTLMIEGFGSREWSADPVYQSLPTRTWITSHPTTIPPRQILAGSIMASSITRLCISSEGFGDDIGPDLGIFPALRQLAMVYVPYCTSTYVAKAIRDVPQLERIDIWDPRNRFHGMPPEFEDPERWNKVVRKRTGEADLYDLMYNT